MGSRNRTIGDRTDHDQRVRSQPAADPALVDFVTASSAVRAAFQTPREAVTGNEFQDVPARWPPEHVTLREEAD